MIVRRLIPVFLIALAVSLDAGAARAAGESNPPPPSSRPEDADYAAGKAAVEAGDFAGAIPLLERVVARNPRNADALNYIGYSYRKIGDFERSLAWYRKALAVEPEHRGANEYLGELYLQMGDLARAEERLAVLDDACFFGCEEYDELKQAIADFKAGRAPGDDDW